MHELRVNNYLTHNAFAIKRFLAFRAPKNRKHMVNGKQNSSFRIRGSETGDRSLLARRGDMHRGAVVGQGGAIVGALL